MSIDATLRQIPRPLGDVFAVEFRPQLWGYFRVMRGSGIEILAVFTRQAGLPDIDWTSKDIDRWRVVFFDGSWMDPESAGLSEPDIIRVGNASFTNDAETHMPPRYTEFKNMKPRYTIEYHDECKDTDDPADLRGIAEKVTLVPGSLGKFLREKYRDRVLKEVAVVGGRQPRPDRPRTRKGKPSRPGRAGRKARMDEARFWSMIESAWRRAGGHARARRRLSKGTLPEEEVQALGEHALDEVVPRLQESLDRLTERELLKFDRILERKLHDIDRADIHEHTDGSDDGFLYSRGFIVAAGRTYYEAVSAKPSLAMMDIECEDICYLPARIYQEKFGEMPASGISRETGSSKDAW